MKLKIAVLLLLSPAITSGMQQPAAQSMSGEQLLKHVQINQDLLTQIYAGNAVKVKEILKENPQFLKPEYNPIGFAAGAEKPDIVTLLLELGSPVDLKDASGRTPLMLAAGYGDINTVLLLLRHGANINELDRKNHTALDHAIKSNRQEITHLLKELKEKTKIK